jgi:starch-binding outer membrane protein, SusD/RagB family
MKEMRKLKIYIFLIFTSFIIWGCKADLLEIEPQGRLFSSNFYDDTEEWLLFGLMGAYDPLHTSFPWNAYPRFWLHALSDDASGGGEVGSDRMELTLASNFELPPDRSELEMLWKTPFQGIYRSNMVVNSKLETPIARDYKAQARVLRAHYYFTLVNFFGDVPLMTSPMNADNYLVQERTPTEMVYEQLEKDLIEAIPNLRLRSEQNLNERGFITRGSAMALLGKVYLFQNKWQEAADVLKDLIDSNQYRLLENYNDVFYVNNPHHDEVIMQITFKKNAGYFYDPHESQQYSVDGNIEPLALNPRNIVLPSDGTNPFGFARLGWGLNPPTKSLADAFLDQNDSVRLYRTLVFGDSLLAHGYKFSQPKDYQGFFAFKYPASTSEFTGEDVNEQIQFSGHNAMLIRYADVLLMYAEAKYRLGEETEARNFINLVRERAKIPLLESGAAGDQLFSALVNERRLELAMEGIRYWDLVRWGLAETYIEKFRPETKGLLPIPTSEILRTGWAQNPGY